MTSCARRVRARSATCSIQLSVQGSKRRHGRPANVWRWGTPCGSYTDLGLIAQPGGAPQGSRTWAQLERDGTKEFETIGNARTQLTCETCEMLFD